MCSSFNISSLTWSVCQPKVATHFHPMLFLLSHWYRLSPLRIFPLYMVNSTAKLCVPHLPVFVTRLISFHLDLCLGPGSFSCVGLIKPFLSSCLHSSLLFLCLCLFSQSFYVSSSSHFCFYVTYVINIHLHFGLPLPCFPCGQFVESFTSLKCVM